MREIEIKKRKFNTEKLEAFGFVVEDDLFSYSCELLDGEFKMKVLVLKDGRVKTEVLDLENEEEYILHNIKNACGAFVGSVREEYETKLSEILSKCFDVDVYKQEKTKECIKYISDKHKNEAEFPWDDENSIVRRADNNKWYAVFMRIESGKIGIEQNEIIEVLNVKIKPDDVEKLIDYEKYFPAYHMNKKHWVTILLSSEISNAELKKRIDESFCLTATKKTKK